MKKQVKKYLSPVGEDLTVAAVSDQFVRELGHARVQVVHDHVHDGRRRSRLARVLADRISPAQFHTSFTPLSQHFTLSEQFQSSFRAVSEQFQSSFRAFLEQF